jgi:hypothetical protein
MASGPIPTHSFIAHVPVRSGLYSFSRVFYMYLSANRRMPEKRTNKQTRQVRYGMRWHLGKHMLAKSQVGLTLPVTTNESTRPTSCQSFSFAILILMQSMCNTPTPRVGSIRRSTQLNLVPSALDKKHCCLTLAAKRHVHTSEHYYPSYWICWPTCGRIGIISTAMQTHPSHDPI